MCCSGVDRGREKGIKGKTSEIRMRSGIYLIVMYQRFLGFDECSVLM